MNIKNYNLIMMNIFKHLSISILFMLMGFFIGRSLIPEYIVNMANLFIIVLLIYILLFKFLAIKNIIPKVFSMNFVYLFTFIMGVLYYPTLIHYFHNLGMEVFISITLGTFILFLTLAIIAYKKTETCFFKLKDFLYPSLEILILVTILGIKFSIFNIIISILGIIIFSGYVLYDVSLIKDEIKSNNLNEKNELSIYVLNLYLDFINILVDLLDLISDIKSN